MAYSKALLKSSTLLNKLEMKILTTTLLLIGGALITHAQMNIELSMDTAYAYGDPSEIHKAEITVTNTGTDAQEMTWMRIKNDIPAEWETSVCDPNLCWAPFASTPGYGWNQEAGEDITFFVQFDGRNLPDGPAVAGNGVVDVMIYSIDDSVNYHARGVFIGDLQSGLGFYSPSMDNVFEVYPNPAINEITLMGSANSGVQEIVIVNIVGKVVKIQPWLTGDGTLTLPVDELPEGIYFVQFVGQDRILSTKKISISR